MTIELLKTYRSKREEIKELEYKLEHIFEGDKLVGNDVILDYRSGYPKPQSVVGNDMRKYYRLKNKWEKRIEQIREECSKIETNY